MKKRRRNRGKKAAGVFLLVAVMMLLLSGCGGNNKDKLESIEQLNQSGYKISVHPGSAAALTAMERFPNAEIVYSNTISDAYLAVSQGKTDAFVYGKLYLQYAVASGALDNLVIMGEAIDSSDIAVGINPDREDLLPRINAFIKQITEDGTLEGMYDRWVVNADTTMPEIERPRSPEMTLKIGTSGLVEPMNYFDENQNLTGFDVEFIYRMGAYLNAEIKLEDMSFDALVASLESGRLDAVVSDLNVTEERKEVILMSEPYMTSETAVLVREEAVNGALTGQQTGQTFFERLAASFRRTFITENRWKMVLDGLLITICLSFASAVLGTLLGFLASFPLRSRNRLVNGISNGISTVLNGLPLVVILMVLYYIVFKSVDISAVWVGIIGFTLDFANTTAGLLNTGVLAVDKGQLEAAEAMGYTRWQVFCKITMPQATNQMFGQYQGAIVGLIKGTAIIGYITVEDLTKAGDIIRSRTYEAFFPLISTAVLYFIIAYAFVFVLKRVGVRLNPKCRPRKVQGVRTHD